jgi:hypothetical protein
MSRGVRTAFRGRSIAAALVLALALAAWEFGGAAITGATDAPAVSRATMTIGARFEGRVRRVVVGDTFWMDAAPVRIRVWGLDAPEADTRAGGAATAAMRRLVDGRRLRASRETSTASGASSVNAGRRTAATSPRR